MSRLSAIVLFLCLCHVCVQSYHLSLISSRFQASRHIHTLRMSSAEGSAAEAVGAAPAGGLKAQLMTDMKDAMKAKDKVKLSGVRAIQAAIKQREIDDRIVVNDDEAILIMSKLIKQIRESIKSYGDAGRQDLVDKEQAELDVVTSYLPVQLSAEDVEKMIDECIVKMGATTIKDMGKVMAELKPVLAGKTDTAAVGALIKKKLGGK
jgi:uncharacterized protein